MTISHFNLGDSSRLRKQGELPRLELSFASTYNLVSARVDEKMARGLYQNTIDRYKLGAGFSRPAIDVPVGFMGIPRLVAEDPKSDAQVQLDRHLQFWSGDIMKAHQMMSRDGEVLVRLRPKNRAPAYRALFNDQKDLELALVPTEAFEIVSKDEDIDALEAIKVKHVFLEKQSGAGAGEMREVVLWEMVTADTIEFWYENNERPRRKLPNPLGYVPAVHLENDKDRHQLHAPSDLEPLEPYMKFYHDVMLHAGAASALHSTAKLIVRVQDVEKFLRNNFTDTEITEGTLRFKNKDVLFFESGQPMINASGSSIYAEGAEIIQAEAPLGDTTTLLEFIFLNIVDVSEIPEWAFGGAIASSKASVTEQSAPLVHKVNRKRTRTENSWSLVGRMMLKTVTGQIQDVTPSWDDLAMRDLKTEAEAIRNFSESLIALNDAEMVSKISVNEVLREIMPKILPYDVDNNRIERSRISSEVAEKQRAARELMDQQREIMEDDDRQAGLRVVGGSNSPDADAG